MCCCLFYKMLRCFFYNRFSFDYRCEAVGILFSKLTSFISPPAPCTPANVGYTYSCETGIALLNWDETLGRESFYAHVRSGDHTLSCSTGQTDCSLPSLLCGRTYDVEVTGVAGHCNSSVPGVAQIQTGKMLGIHGGTFTVCTSGCRWTQDL